MMSADAPRTKARFIWERQRIKKKDFFTGQDTVNLWGGGVANEEGLSGPQLFHMTGNQIV